MGKARRHYLQLNSPSTAVPAALPFKGTVQRDFRPPVFLSFEPAWATDQRVKIVLILV